MHCHAVLAFDLPVFIRGLSLVLSICMPYRVMYWILFSGCAYLNIIVSQHESLLLIAEAQQNNATTTDMTNISYSSQL